VTALALFWTFFRISVFTVGGGYNMIPLMQHDLDAAGWMPADRFLDLLAIAEATPGPIAVNAATFAGRQVAGLPGALAATAGACLPGVLLLLALGALAARLRRTRAFHDAMYGLFPAFAALLLATAGRMALAAAAPLRASPAPAASGVLAAALFLFALAAFLRGRLHPLKILAASALAGILFHAAVLPSIGKNADNLPDLGKTAAGPVFRRTTMRIRGFDPANAVDEPTSLATGKIYEGLLQYDYYARPYRLRPLLAAAMPELSPDGLELRIPIRPGIHFSDDPCFAATGGRGRELVAEDFIYSIKRIADTKVASGGYWAFRGKILGLDDFRAASASDAPTDYDLPVPGLSAPDPHTLVIRLAAPYPQLPWVLAMPFAYAVPREAVETYGREFLNHPVGTGPYVLASARPNYRYEYALNPKWAETGRADAIPPDAPAPWAGRPLPLVPRIVESVVGDASTAWLMFLSGQLDLTAIPRDYWETVIAPDGTLRPEIAARGIRLAEAPSLQTAYIALNLDDPLLADNRPLRQALAAGFDTPAWNEFQNHRYLSANGPVPPSIAGAFPEGQPPPFPYDPDRAAELLARAGYPGGRDPATGRRLALTLTLGKADSPETRQAAELVASFYDRLGLALRLEYLNWPNFLEKIEKRQAQLFQMAWLGDYPDAQNFLQLFYSPNASPGPNRANYSSPAFDALYERLAALPPDAPERADLCRKAAAILMADVPWILLGYPLTTILHHDRLRNYLPHDFPAGMEKYYALSP
jgi:ABC-type transport system substrate-binding protein